MPGYKPGAGRFLDEDDEWADHENLGWAGKLEEPKVYAAGVASAPRNRPAAEALPLTPLKPTASDPPAGTPAPGASAAPHGDEPITSEAHLMEVFNAIDEDGSGSLTAEELRKVLRRYVNKHIRQEEVDALIEKSDRDHDGKISIKEFMSIVKSGALGGLAPGETEPPPPPPEGGEPVRKAEAGYSVTITTGTDSGAGTDANVWVQLFGTTGVSKEVELGNGTDMFEKGSVDTFPVHEKSVGDLVKIRIWHDDTGEGPGWQLAKVEVTEGPAVFTFIAAPPPASGAWLGGSADTVEMEIEVHVQEDEA